MWGALHGGYLILGIVTQEFRDALWHRLGKAMERSSRRHKAAAMALIPSVSTVRKYLSVFTTFHLVLLGWVFFRANTIEDAFLVLEKILSVDSGAVNGIEDVALGTTGFTIAIGAIAFMELVHLLERKADMRKFLSSRSRTVRWGVYYGLTFAIIFTGIFNQNAFIYFQF